MPTSTCNPEPRSNAYPPLASFTLQKGVVATSRNTKKRETYCAGVVRSTFSAVPSGDDVVRVTTSVSPTMTRDVAVTQAAETTIPSTRFADAVVFLPPLLFIKLSGSSRHPAGAAAQLSHPSHCLVTPPNCVINCLSQAFRVQVLCPFHLPFVGPHRTSYLTQQLHPRTFGCKCRVLETLNKMKRSILYISWGSWQCRAPIPRLLCCYQPLV